MCWRYPGPQIEIKISNVAISDLGFKADTIAISERSSSSYCGPTFAKIYGPHQARYYKYVHD